VGIYTLNKKSILIISSLTITLFLLFIFFTNSPHLYIDVLDTASFKEYMEYQATCNDIQGKPDAQCFIESFEKCEYATMKNMVYSVEGDPVFSYAEIIEDGCQLVLTIDDRLDKHGHNSLLDGIVCTDVRLSETGQLLEVTCDDSGDSYGFNLW